MSYCDPFKGKKITVMGLGLLGRGVGDTAFLSECGAELIVTDLKSEAELRPSLEQLKGYRNIQYVLGGHRREDFRERDLILKAAGIPLESEYLEEAEAHDIPVEMSASLVAKLTPATVVGITGTRGKSTVTQLLYHILKAAGRDVHLAGNVRGIATLPVLEEADKDSIIVMELDSWQLQGFGVSHSSPHIGIFTTFYPDHMVYYHDDMERYFADKANIFMYQKKGDHLITTDQSHRAILRYSKVVPGNETVVRPYDTNNPALVGEHNKENAACAAEAARGLGVPEKDIEKAIESFPGVEGRLQFVREVNGVKVYNDNNATSPDATTAALKALSKRKNIVLIIGGSDKGLNMRKLIEEIPEHCKGVVLFAGKGTDTIRDDIQKLEDVAIKESSDLNDSVEQALGMAEKGDVLLFSPAFASFGTFKNEYDRNDQFLSVVEKLS